MTGPGEPSGPGYPSRAGDTPPGGVPALSWEEPAAVPPEGVPGAGPEGGGPPGTPARRRRTDDARRRLRLLVLVLVGLVVVVVLAVALWVRAEADPGGPEGRQVLVTVAKGSGVGTVLDDLQHKGVIGSPLAFRIWSQFNGTVTVQPGIYALHRNSSFGTVRTILVTGPNVFALDIPPGFTVRETAARVGQLPGHGAAAFAKLATSGEIRSPWQPAGSTNLDGLLGTGSYQVVPGETDTQLLRAMIARFDTLADQVQLATRAPALGLTPYEAITVASIVEKEAVIEKNMGMVARVVLNRLANRMPLQMDSTVLYALGRDGGTVTRADLATRTPYNTYLNKGLTPTPICFPSPAALQATLDPPQGAWLYFVVVEKDGTEAFSDTYAGQQANEALAASRGLP